MNIHVEYKENEFSSVVEKQFSLNYLAILKHFAFAGQGFAPRLYKLRRLMGMALHYFPYLQGLNSNNFFSQPIKPLSDPTEKGQFSNLVGLAFADYLAKRIEGCRITVNYEAAMRILDLPIIGNRPDLLAISPDSFFALEAKGYSNGPRNMNDHKIQAQSGKILVSHSIASVTYNIYNEIHCKFFDPKKGNFQFDAESYNALTKSYYSGILEFIKQGFFEIENQTINSEDYHALRLTPKTLGRFFFGKLSFPAENLIQFLPSEPRILITKRVEEFAEKGLKKNIPSFHFTDENAYLDNDGIGVLSW